MDVSTSKKRRGISRASITKLTTKLKDLESKADQPGTFDLSQRMKQWLETLDSEFKTHHYAIVDHLEHEADLQHEQEMLDDHDDEISILTIRIQQLIALCAPKPVSDLRKTSSRRLTHLQKSLSSVHDAIGALTGEEDDIFVLRQHEEQLLDYKKELSDVRSSLLSEDLSDEDELNRQLSNLEKELFDCSLSLKRSLKTPSHSSSTADGKGVKLPKLDVPTFDGNILNWRTFWEQFRISIHDRSSLSDSEKLVYLQHALKNGSAKATIEGLSRSGECYAEAIDCLKSRYNHPRLIHQIHVKMILDAAALKDGTGKELRRLHDTVQQHLRALKAMDYEPSGPFITSILELKLDATTRFEWQKHSQESTEVPPYQELLDFLNLRAQASETSTPDNSKKASGGKRPFVPTGPVASFTTSTSEVSNCVVCKDKHPLYACPKFKSLPHDRMVSTLKANSICINCLRPGHFIKQCRSLHRCKKCQKPHHTLLHIEGKDTPTPTDPAPTNSTPTGPTQTTPAVSPVTSNAAMGSRSDSLLMTCRVLVNAPDGSSIEARALLDSASSASFVSERLAQSLSLTRSTQNIRISGIAGISHKSPSQSVANFSIAAVRFPTKKIEVTAIVVPRVTCNLPLYPVSFDAKWKHLSDLQLADPTFGQPGRIDVLLGVDILVQILLHGRRIGPPGSPAAFETELGWVLAGGGASCYPATEIATHHTLLSSSDDLLQRFWETEESPMRKPLLSPEERSVVKHFEANHSRTGDGRFVVPLPRKPDSKPLGESRSQCVRRFVSLEHSLRRKGQFTEFSAVMEEYIELGHAEIVPDSDLNKPPQSVFYLPVHAVRKESSTTTKVRAVFDASAKSSTGVSLNDTLLVGPTVHSSLVDVLLRFRSYRVALTTDRRQQNVSCCCTSRFGSRPPQICLAKKPQ